MFLDRAGYKIVPEMIVQRPPENPGSRPTPVPEMEGSEEKSVDSGNASNWANFLECVRTRQKPISDIEVCNRSTSTCLLGNVALRTNLRLDWDAQKWTTAQPDAHPYLTRPYRKPWQRPKAS